MAKKTIRGYTIRIDGFVPVDTQDPQSQIDTGQAVLAAKEGDVGDLVAMMKNVSMKQSFVGRQVEEDELADYGVGNEADDDDDGQMDLEDHIEEADDVEDEEQGDESPN